MQVSLEQVRKNIGIMNNQEIKEILLKAVNEWEEFYLYALKIELGDFIFVYAIEKNMEYGLCHYLVEHEQIIGLIEDKISSPTNYLCRTIKSIYLIYPKDTEKYKESIRTRIDFLEELIKDLEK